MGWQPNYQSESHITRQYLLKEKPDAKIAVLYQNDDYARLSEGLKESRAKRPSMIVAEEVMRPPSLGRQPHRQAEIDRPDVFFNVTTPKIAAQAIKKIAESNGSAAPSQQCRRLGSRRTQAGGI